MRDEQMIEEELNEAIASSAVDKQRYPGMSYEEGVRDALAWALEESDDAPLTGSGD